VTARLLVCALAAGLAACGPRHPVVDPAIAARATLAEADANLRAGRFDCLAEALRRYESVRTVSAVSSLAVSAKGSRSSIVRWSLLMKWSHKAERPASPL
jgi:hypothetical protein